MIGLEYICKEYKVQYKEIAKMIDVTPGTFNDWISGRRKIPQIRKEKLASLDVFKGIPEDYYQLELDELQKREIDGIRMRKELKFGQIDTSFIDDDGNIVKCLGEVVVNGSIEFIQMNDADIDYLKSIRRVQKSLDLTTCENFDDVLNGIIEHSELINLFGEILESKKMEKQFLKRILFSVLIYFNERKGIGKVYRGYEDDKFVKQLVKVFEREYIKLKKIQNDEWNEMKDLLT